MLSGLKTTISVIHTFDKPFYIKLLNNIDKSQYYINFDMIVKKFGKVKKGNYYYNSNYETIFKKLSKSRIVTLTFPLLLPETYKKDFIDPYPKFNFKESGTSIMYGIEL